MPWGPSAQEIARAAASGRSSIRSSSSRPWISATSERLRLHQIARLLQAPFSTVARALSRLCWGRLMNLEPKPPVQQAFIFRLPLLPLVIAIGQKRCKTNRDWDYDGLRQLEQAVMNLTAPSTIEFHCAELFISTQI